MRSRKPGVSRREPDSREPWNSVVATVGVSLTGILQWLALLFLAIISFWYTWVFKRQAGEGKITDLSPYNVMEDMTLEIGRHSLATGLGALFLLIFVFLLCRWASLRHVSTNTLSVIVFLSVFLLSSAWVVARGMFNYSYPDTQSLSDGASALVAHDYRLFSDAYCQTAPHACTQQPWLRDYLGLYPFQAGPMIWFWFVYKIFGTNNIMAIQYINCLFAAGVAVLLVRIGKGIGLHGGGLVTLTFLLVACIPWLMESMYAYTDGVGLFFALLSLLLTEKAVTTQRPWWVQILWCLLSFFVAGVGLVFKSTFIILVIAQVAALIVVAFVGRRWWLPIAGAVFAYGGRALSKLSVPFLGHEVGQTFGKGLPTSAWLVIGLGKGEVGLPGWWSPVAVHATVAAHGNPALLNRILRQELWARLNHWADHPSAARQFFLTKLSSEWADPTFETMYHSESGFARSADGISRAILTGRLHESLFRYEDAYQLFLYMAATAGVFAFFTQEMRAIDATTLFLRTTLSAAFVGGFLCYSIWEAKSTYTLPFFLLLLPFAALGTEQATDFLFSPHKRAKQRGEEYTEVS